MQERERRLVYYCIHLYTPVFYLYLPGAFVWVMTWQAAITTPLTLLTDIAPYRWPPPGGRAVISQLVDGRGPGRGLNKGVEPPPLAHRGVITINCIGEGSGWGRVGFIIQRLWYTGLHGCVCVQMYYIHRLHNGYSIMQWWGEYSESWECVWSSKQCVLSTGLHVYMYIYMYI